MNLLKKTLILVTLAVAGITSANAQQQGDIVVGGTIGFSNDKNTGESTGTVAMPETIETHSSSFSIIPSVHYFITDNIAVGASIGYNSSKDFAGFGGANSDIPMYDKVGALYFAPSAYYYIQLCDKLYYTPSVYVGILSGSIKNEVANSDAIDTQEASLSGFEIGVSLARFEYKATDKLGLGVEFGIGQIEYMSNKVTNEAGGTTQIIKETNLNGVLNGNTSLGSISLSASYYF